MLNECINLEIVLYSEQFSALFIETQIIWKQISFGGKVECYIDKASQLKWINRLSEKEGILKSCHSVSKLWIRLMWGRGRCLKLTLQTRVRKNSASVDKGMSGPVTFIPEGVVLGFGNFEKTF